MRGAELQIPHVYYYVMGYITPVFLIVIFVGYVFQPKAGWDGYAHAMTQGTELPPWEWSPDGMIGKLLNKDVQAKPEDTEARKGFLEKVRFWRIISRLAMLGAFVAYCSMVFIAWKKRRREGLHTGEEPAYE
jgi:hypothetical protein